MEKSKLKCKTPAKAQVNYKKGQRIKMNRAERRKEKKDTGSWWYGGRYHE
jgi:hypothetical protein